MCESMSVCERVCECDRERELDQKGFICASVYAAPNATKVIKNQLSYKECFETMHYTLPLRTAH